MPNYTVSNSPASAVKNKLNAATHEELENLEASYVRFRGFEIEISGGEERTFNAAHLKAIHHYLFQDVFEWSGHTRDENVKLSDGTIANEPLMRKSDGKAFMAGPLIAKALDGIAASLRDANYLRGLLRAEFAHAAADIMARINGVHAFREGNGRTQRVFMGQLAAEAGHSLDFTVISRERMIQASIAANERNDTSMMRRLFDDITTPSRIAALTPAIEALAKHGFAWNDNYVAAMQQGYEIEVTMAGRAGLHFMARTASAVLIGQVKDLPEPMPKTGETCSVIPSEWPEDL